MVEHNEAPETLLEGAESGVCSYKGGVPSPETCS